MEQYISKSALVAEIERRKEKYITERLRAYEINLKGHDEARKDSELAKIEPKFQIGEHIAPIRKSIYCDFEEPSLIKGIDDYKEVYIIQTKNNQLRVSFMMQDYYREVIPNRQQMIK